MAKKKSRQEEEVLEWTNQSLDFNQIVVLWHDIKQAVYARKPSKVAESKQFSKEE